MDSIRTDELLEALCRANLTLRQALEVAKQLNWRLTFTATPDLRGQKYQATNGKYEVGESK